MDPHGFDYKALRTAASAPSNPPFSMLQKPNNSRKPFAFIQTQSRNLAENYPVQPPSQIPQANSARRSADVPRMKQEAHDVPLFPGMRQSTQIPQPRAEAKSQSTKLRAFTMGNAVHDELSARQQFAPQHFSSPNPSSLHASESRNYGLPQSPEPRHIPKSRSPSLVEEDFDAEDADLSQLMVKRMRDVKLLKTKLAEQRLATAELESRLSAQLSASEASELALKNRILELETRETTRRAQAEDELQMARAQSTDAERKLQELRVAASTSVDSLTNKYTDLQKYLKELKTEYDVSQESLKNIFNELTTIRNDTVENLRGLEAADHIGRSAETRALIDELEKNITSSHQVNDMLRDKLHLLSAQLVEAKDRISELETKREGKIERVEARLEDLTNTLAKQEKDGARLIAEKLVLELLEAANSVKSKELDLRNSADKLSALTEKKIALECQLQEERSKIVSLEDIASNIGSLRAEKISLECLVKEQTTKISALQIVEAESSVVKDRNISLQCAVQEGCSRVAALEQDLSAARDECASLKLQLKESASRLTSLEESHRETTAKLEKTNDHARQLDLQRVQQDALSTQLRVQLDQANEQLRSSREEVRSSREELRSSKEELRSSREDLRISKAETHSTLETSHKTATKAKEDIAASALREAVLQEKADQLMGRVSKLNADALVREEDSRRVNTNAAILQERFEAQAITLKLAKEQSGDLQERLLISEKSHAAELESTSGKLNVEIAILREQKANLQTSLNQVMEESATQRTGFLAATIDYENKMNEQKEIHAKLVEAEERKTGVAEKEAAEANRLVTQLEQQWEVARTETEDAKRKLREAISAKSSSPNGEAIVLQARLEELEAENFTLQNRSRTLQSRYQDGDLSDSEKAFVNSLMQMSQSVHEQEMVAKENELRRRENMNNSHQTRIDSLESTLARLLKERGKDNEGPNSKSMVDLNVWMASSSPHTPQEAPGNPPSGSAPVPAAAATKKSSKPAKHSGPTSSPGPHSRGLSAIGAEASDDDISSASEDEKPIAVTLGKRTRTPNVTQAESSRPTRRQRGTASRKVDMKADPEKVPTEATKTKQRKRR
ncbi:hypothetical protein C8F01DRAFT_1243071 [Mycena amicta]|nr:hypothetical protein C8F01DRAFT_1243071 [Mycena amicta]